MMESLNGSAGSDSRADAARSCLLEAVRDRAILRAQERRLRAENGRPISWLMDLRIVMNEPAALDAIAELFWLAHEEHLPFQVGGLEMAAVPLVAAILMKSVERGTPVGGFIVRKERKQHGAANVVEGRLSDLPIIIVDDLLNSGQSLDKVMAVLDCLGKRPSQAFVVMDFESKQGSAWRERHGMAVSSLLQLKDFGLSVGPKQARPESRIPQPIFEEAWVHKSRDPNHFLRVPKSFPTSDGERVYFGSDCGTFWALDAREGSVRWTFQVHTRGHKNLFSAPAVHQGRVYFGAYDGSVYCLDARSGAVVWTFGEADTVSSSPAIAADLGLLFIGLCFEIEGCKGAIVALDLETGERVWEHKTKRYTHASPAYWAERKLVACGSNDDELFLFEAESGRLKWRFQTRGEGRKGSIRHAPAFDRARAHVITGCADGYIYVVDIETGREVWSVKTENEIYSIPLVVGDQAFLGSTDCHFYVLDLKTQSVRNRFFTGTKIYSPPRLIDQFVYFGGCDGVVRKLDPLSGRVVGRHQLPEALTNAILFDGHSNLFYVLSAANMLHALRPLAAEMMTRAPSDCQAAR